MPNMASATSKSHHRKKPPVAKLYQRTQSWVEPRFESPTKRPSFFAVASMQSAKPPKNTPILNLPYETLHQICQEVVWDHLLHDEVVTLRCSSRQCTNRERSKRGMPPLRPKKPLSNETDEEALSRKLELLDFTNSASTNKHISLLLVCKRIQQVVQEILYCYLFCHVHVQALGTEWRLRDDFFQISYLNLYGHKLRNVMMFVEVNTTTQGTTFSGGRHFRKEQVDRQNSHNDKVYERKKQLQAVVEMLTQDRQHEIMNLSVGLSILPELVSFAQGALPKWKVALVQDTLRPLGGMKGHVNSISELPLENKPYGSLRSIKVFPWGFELNDIVKATVKSLVLE
jgi:hypothetical protein